MMKCRQEQFTNDGCRWWGRGWYPESSSRLHDFAFKGEKGSKEEIFSYDIICECYLVETMGAMSPYFLFDLFYRYFL